MSESFGVKVRIGPRRSASKKVPEQGEQEIVRPHRGSTAIHPIPRPQAPPILARMTQVETQTEDALEILLSADLEPIVDMVLRRHDDGTYEALSHDGGRDVPAHRTRPRRVRDRRRHRLEPVRRHRHRPVQPPRPTSGRNPYPEPVRERLSVRLRPHRPAVRRARGPRPLRDPLRGPQLGGPGRPPRRARLPRDRPGPGAVGHRRQGRAQRRGRRRSRPASSTSPRRSRRCSAVVRSASTTGARRTSRARTARCATTCSTSRAVGRAWSSASSSTAPTRTCSTTWPRG